MVLVSSVFAKCEGPRGTTEPGRSDSVLRHCLGLRTRPYVEMMVEMREPLTFVNKTVARVAPTTGRFELTGVGARAHSTPSSISSIEYVVITFKINRLHGLSVFSFPSSFRRLQGRRLPPPSGGINPSHSSAGAVARVP